MEIDKKQQYIFKRQIGDSQFDSRTAAKLQVEVDDFFGKMENDFKNTNPKKQD